MPHLWAAEHRRTTLLCFLAAIVALFVAQIPNDTRSEWFRSLTRPDVLPRELERKIGLIWTTLFLLAGWANASGLASERSRSWKTALLGLTLLALLCNFAYTYTFTYQHDLRTATFIAAALAGVAYTAVGLGIAGRVWSVVIGFLPHALWVTFATYVTYQMDLLNS